MSGGRGGAPVLLTKADYCGTLAAARVLGERGIPVTMASERWSDAATWSRHVTRRWRCPPLPATDALLAALHAFGEREPGHVLYPTCDDLAWLFAEHADSLSRHYLMYSPPVDSLDRLLDKACLHALCAAVGFDAPRSWFPKGPQDLAQVADEARFPLLIKQRTQVLSLTNTKGTLVRDASELEARYVDFARRNRHGAALARRLPQACLPMLQEYHPEVLAGTMVVAGFVSRQGELLASRAAEKVLQQPRRLGIALCLEQAELPAEIRRKVVELCRLAGFFGVFHLELIRSQGRLLLIDFNPRYYHHLAFEVACGMPLPLFVYHAACGDEEALAALTAASAASQQVQDRVFTHRLQLEVMLQGQRLTGRMSASEASRWRQWHRAHRSRITDAVSDRGDLLPGVVDALIRLQRWARHPRAFVRQMLLEA